MAAGEVRGLGIVAEAAQIDHPGDALLGGNPSEVFGRAPVALLEVTAATSAHRVHEVVRDLHPFARAAQAGRVEDVALRQLQPPVRQMIGPVRVANETANLPAATRERSRQPAADKAGRTGDERSAGHLPRPQARFALRG